MILVVYVDDVLVFTPTESEMDSIIDSLRERKLSFNLVTDFSFIGVEVISSDNGENITLLKSDWLKGIETVGMIECNTKDTPTTGKHLEQIYMELRCNIHVIILQLFIC